MINDEVNLDDWKGSDKSYENYHERRYKSGKSLNGYLSEKMMTNLTKLKNMVQKGQLENMNDLHDDELKELKKQLNKYGINFSAMKDKKTGLYPLFF